MHRQDSLKISEFKTKWVNNIVIEGAGDLNGCRAGKDRKVGSTMGSRDYEVEFHAQGTTFLRLPLYPEEMSGSRALVRAHA